MSRWILAVLLLIAATARAADLDPAGGLARWLDADAGPELAEVLARHPRFAGATTAFVAVVDGAPTDRSDRLHDAIERRLRGHLLRSEGVRLALPRSGDACAPGARPDLLVGIDIARRGTRDVTVALGLIDAVEGVWISGVAHDWRGTLSTAEARALATPSPAAPAAFEAVPVADADAVAAALVERLRCTWPAGLAGRVHLAMDAEPAAAPRIAAALRARLGRGTSVLVADPATADWQLRLELDAAGQAPEARLLLAPRDDAPGQQLASVFVTTGGASPRAPAAIPMAPEVAAPSRPRQAGPLVLTAPRVEQVPLDGVCRRDGRDVLCAELAVALEAPGWLFLFSTRDGRAGPLDCDPTPERSDAGERRFRIAVGVAVGGAGSGATDRPDTGLYVLAVRERELARELARLLRSAPGACGTQAGRPLEDWLEGLAALLARHPEGIEWHAVHLVRRGDRVVRLQGS